MSDEVEQEVEEVIEDAEEIVEEEDEPKSAGAIESAGDEVKALASAVAAKATEEAFIEIPVMQAAPGGDDEPPAGEEGAGGGGKEDEKTDDQITEIEDDIKGAGGGSQEDFRDIPVEADSSQADAESIVEVSVVEDIETSAAMDEEPPPKEAPESSSPTARKKVTIEESPPASPKKEESPTRKEPSWWSKNKKAEDEEEEVIEAESVEQKSKSESQPPPSASEPEPEAKPAEPEPEPEPVKEEEPAAAPAEPEPEPEPAKEDSVHEEPAAKPQEDQFFEVPVVTDEEPTAEPAATAEEEPSTVVIETTADEEPESKPEAPAEEKKEEPTAAVPAARETVASSPPRERQSRFDKTEEDRSTRAAVAADSVYASTLPTRTPIARTPTYVTYSSWAPVSDYRSSYIPTYSAYVRPSSYYQSTYDYSSTSNYVRPTSQYLRNFDSYVRTGSFGQSSYATDRLRTRSRSRDRPGYTRTGYYAMPPLRRNRDYSLPSRYSQASGPPSAAPSRSGSFVNFMDYIVTTDRNLRRSSSRASSIGEDYAPLSRSASLSRTILPTPADTINHYYSKKIAHVDNYVRRLNQVYDNNVYGYSSNYNTSKPFTGYLTAGLGDYSTYNRSLRGYSTDLERRLATHSTYLRAYDLTRLPKTAAHQYTMKRSTFW